MAKKNSTQELEIEYRRQCVKDTWIKLGAVNVTQDQITERLAEDYKILVDRSTVSRDLAVIKTRMQKEAPEDLKAFLYGGYLWSFGEAKDAWYRSLEDAETTIQEIIKANEGDGDGDGNGQRAKISKRKEGQSGNPALLAQAQGALRAIREMFGVDTPVKIQHSGEVGKIEMSVEEWKQLRRERLTGVTSTDDPECGTQD